MIESTVSGVNAVGSGPAAASGPTRRPAARIARKGCRIGRRAGTAAGVCAPLTGVRTPSAGDEAAGAAAALLYNRALANRPGGSSVYLSVANRPRGDPGEHDFCMGWATVRQLAAPQSARSARHEPRGAAPFRIRRSWRSLHEHAACGCSASGARSPVDWCAAGVRLRTGCARRRTAACGSPAGAPAAGAAARGAARRAQPATVPTPATPQIQQPPLAPPLPTSIGERDDPGVQAAPILEQRGGGSARKLSVDEAVQLALEQNLDVQVERINPQLQDLADRIRPRASGCQTSRGQLNFTSSTTPPDSSLSGADDALTSKRLFGTGGVDQLLPFGTSYSVGWDASRQTIEQHVLGLQSAAGVELQPQRHPAAAARAAHRRQPRDLLRAEEEPGDHRRRAAATDRADHAPGAQRLLEPRRRALQPRRRAGLARHLAPDAQGQPHPRRGRHHGADRHRPGRSRSGAQRGVGDHRRGARSISSRTRCGRSSSIRSSPSSGRWTSTSPSRRSCRRPRTSTSRAAVKTALEKRTDLIQQRKNLEAQQINLALLLGSAQAAAQCGRRLRADRASAACRSPSAGRARPQQPLRSRASPRHDREGIRQRARRPLRPRFPAVDRRRRLQHAARPQRAEGAVSRATGCRTDAAGALAAQPGAGRGDRGPHGRPQRQHQPSPRRLDPRGAHPHRAAARSGAEEVQRRSGHQPRRARRPARPDQRAQQRADRDHRLRQVAGRLRGGPGSRHRRRRAWPSTSGPTGTTADAKTTRLQAPATATGYRPESFAGQPRLQPAA